MVPSTSVFDRPADPLPPPVAGRGIPEAGTGIVARCPELSRLKRIDQLMLYERSMSIGRDHSVAQLMQRLVNDNDLLPWN